MESNTTETDQISTSVGSSKSASCFLNLSFLVFSIIFVITTLTNPVKIITISSNEFKTTFLLTPFALSELFEPGGSHSSYDRSGYSFSLFILHLPLYLIYIQMAKNFFNSRSYISSDSNIQDLNSIVYRFSNQISIFLVFQLLFYYLYIESLKATTTQITYSLDKYWILFSISLLQTILVQIRKLSGNQ